MATPWKITLDQIDAGTHRYVIPCPDGIERWIWGTNRQTGDVFIDGWPGEAWMDCSSGQFAVRFTKC
jgi:hypothetical protein